MHIPIITTLLLTLPLLSIAAATTTTPSSITPDQIAQIAPTSQNCTNPPAKGECANAEQAARYITISFENYDVTSRAEQAAVIGLLAFESTEFKYARNHFPGVVGQGTRNMQSPAYNKEYAYSLHAIKSKVRQTNGDKGQILDLLLADKEYDFGSGAWFLTTQCGKDVRAELQKGTEEGWESYIKECVGTEANEGRRGYWKKAVEVWG